MKWKRRICAAGAVVLAIAGVAYAQMDPHELIAARVNGYRQTGAAFKSLSDQLKSETPVKVVLRRAARTIAVTATDQYKWFAAGSGPAAGVKTHAKAVIWTDAARFREVQARFQREADLMTKVVETDDIGAMKKQAKALGGACAACHQKFREKD